MKVEAIVVEWRQKYDTLAEELHSLRMSRRQAESKCEMAENESFRREAAQKAEVSCLRKQLSDAESKVASLEAEVDSLSREKVALQKPIKSPQGSEYTGLVRRHNAARLITEELTNRNIALTRELAVWKQALAASEAKLSLVAEQLEKEKVSHANDVDERDQVVQALHRRVANLLGDRGCAARRCDSLLTEILQDREGTICELISTTDGSREQPRGSVKPRWEGDGCVTKAPQLLQRIDETASWRGHTNIARRVF
ncbi:unnamed protein product [Mesocestoides corti]|uniref:Uncharacterized protein n=1 Tax=Mesocestoides corti TaxID=53468 RepID=A0A0R3U8T0_MESCO|nr:unnamed protein product [Mesocestoides corti]